MDQKEMPSIIGGAEVKGDNRRVSILALADGSYILMGKMLRTDGDTTPAAHFGAKVHGKNVVATTAMRLSYEAMESIVQIYLKLKAERLQHAKTLWQVSEGGAEGEPD